jgi:cellulose synthase (UDP-forming)
MKYSKQAFLWSLSPHWFIAASASMCLIYFGVLTFVFPPGSWILFSLLVIGEAFHAWQALTYLYTISDLRPVSLEREPLHKPLVDVFITVAGEPTALVAETILAAKAMDYPWFTVYVLNDGYVAQKDNWQDIERLAAELGVQCFTREHPGGAKAGNINHALARTLAPYVAIFDADHVPHPDFLTKTMVYFEDSKMGFVQTPQYYKNGHRNAVTRGAWEQQELFYGPICRGKNAYNAATMCGTNMVLSRRALTAVGGMCADSIAEDFATGMFMHEQGYKSFYHSEVLAEGLAPEDFHSYTKQQYRWARGALDVLFKYRLLTRRGLSWSQKIQYLASVSYFLSAPVTVFNMLLPVLFLYFGFIPVQISTMLLALVFVPYILLILTALSKSSNYRFTYRAVSFAISSFWIHLQAIWSALLGKKTTFAITSKEAVAGNYTKLVAPHLLYIALVIGGIPLSVMREGWSASVVNNLAWACFSIGIMLPFVQAATPQLRLAVIRQRLMEVVISPWRWVYLRFGFRS